MTDCEKCPNWRPDENGSHNCQTRYCIDDPLAAEKEEADDLWEFLQAEHDVWAEEERQMALAYDEEYRAFQQAGL